MEYNYKLTKKIENFLNGAAVEEIGIGYSNSQVLKIVKGENIYYLKMAPNGFLKGEYERLSWLSSKVSDLVPQIISFESENGVEYLLTESLKGEMLCSDYYLSHPNEGLDIVVDAFKKLYEIDITDCPFNVALDYKLSLVRSNLDNHLIDEANVDSNILKKYGSLEGIYEFLVNNRFHEDLCFSHGDISLPNIFAFDGKLSGFIDLGDAGIADRYFDIAIVTRTLIYNYGEEYAEKFYEKMGIDVDRSKIDYYLTMMELYL